MLSKSHLNVLQERVKDKDWVWLNRDIVHLLEGRGKRKIGVINFDVAALKYWDNLGRIKLFIVGHSIKKLKEYPKLLLMVRNEALPNYRWKEIVDFILEITGKNIEDIMVVDAGYTTDGSYPHIGTNPFVINPVLDLTSVVRALTPISQRKTFYNSLSRNPKNFRLLFTLELVKRDLLNLGCVSFGVSDDYGDELYKELIPAEYTHLFPMYADGIVKRNQYVVTYPPEAIDSIVKVVLESTYDDSIIPGTKCTNYCGGIFSDRVFLTEKTFFAFQSYQIPLFVTVKGHVQAVRDHGFDVFDDIVDHSYDLEPNPGNRIKMVADELERLLKNKDSIMSVTNLNERRKKNNQHRQIVQEQIGKNLKEKLTEWFNQ